MAMSCIHQPGSVVNNGSSLFTIEEIDERVQQLLGENAELRNTLQQNNTYMRMLINTLMEWHNQVDQIHSTYRDKFDKAKEVILQLKSENSLIKEKLFSTVGHELVARENLSPRSPNVDIKEIMDSFVMVEENPCKQQPIHPSTLTCNTPRLKQNLNSLAEAHYKLEKVTQENNTNNQGHSESRIQQLEKTNNILNQQCRELSEKITSLNARLSVAEELVLAKQTQNTELLMDVARLEKSAEILPILKAQLELYQSDFEAEREAREKLAGEKDTIAQELRLLKRKLDVLQYNSPAPSISMDNAQTPQPFECPKCGFKYSTFVSLNNHLDECLNQQMFPI